MAKSGKFTDRQFFVTATRDIGPNIKKGDHLLIDPDRAPTPGKYVLADGRLFLFQKSRAKGLKVAGVAVSIERDLSGVVVGRFVPEDEPSHRKGASHG